MISQAHEWVHAQGLCGDDGKFDSSLQQSDGQYVPTLALEDPFSGADASEYYAEGVDDSQNAGETLGYCEAIQFPDGSAVWWSDEFWSFTDPHGLDVGREWQLNEATRPSKRR